MDEFGPRKGPGRAERIGGETSPRTEQPVGELYNAAPSTGQESPTEARSTRGPGPWTESVQQTGAAEPSGIEPPVGNEPSPTAGTSDGMGASAEVDPPPGSAEIHVDREPPAEVEPEPAAAATLFGPEIERARRYAVDLVRYGEELGLIGPQELARLWSRHLINCALVAPLLRPGMVGDVGSGAGLPGLVLAIARPDVRFVLIEPMERRADWLREEAGRLALSNVEVLRGRAEEVGALGLDQVTARAVAALRSLIPLTAPLAKAGGELLLMKGARVADEVTAARKQIAGSRLRDVEVLELGHGVADETTRVFRATVG